MNERREHPRLVGERVILRRPRRSDVAALEQMFADPEVMRYVAWGRPLTHAEIEEFVGRMVARFEHDGIGQFVLERRVDGAVMGRAGLLPLDPATWQSGFLSDLVRTRRSSLVGPCDAPTGDAATRRKRPCSCGTGRGTTCSCRG